MLLQLTLWQGGGIESSGRNSLAWGVFAAILMAVIGDYLFGYAGIFGATARANVINGLAAVYWNHLSVGNAIERSRACLGVSERFLKLLSFCC